MSLSFYYAKSACAGLGTAPVNDEPRLIEDVWLLPININDRLWSGLEHERESDCNTVIRYF